MKLKTAYSFFSAEVGNEQRYTSASPMRLHGMNRHIYSIEFTSNVQKYIDKFNKL